MTFSARHFTDPTCEKPIGPVLCGTVRQSEYLFGSRFMAQTKDVTRVTCKRCLAKLAKGVIVRGPVQGSDVVIQHPEAKP